MVDLVSILQSAVGPVVLVSGAGLLLVGMENRLARVVDRSRYLIQKIEDGSSSNQKSDRQQLDIFTKRSFILRRAIALISISVLFDAVLVIFLFFTGLFKADVPWVAAGLFIICMLLLIGSLVEFTRDVNKSLAAFQLEVRDHRFEA
jgi:hypothetical protein